MRHNKLLSIKQIFQKNYYYSSYRKILFKIYLHTNILIKINTFIKKYIPVELHNWYNIKNFKDGILIIETCNASSMTRFLYEKTNIIFFLKKNLIPSLIDINIQINPAFYIKKNIIIPNEKNTYKKNILSKYSANLLLNLARKSPIKLRYIIERFAKSASKH
ncbi:DUF721 domain-containing protein [Enterobacteriaceae endosymbiont of Donacia tomentosa]|uniref:DUF721 domain-containing protein n=1 Tax=Enterobacteriaceae endosymbiont of Donacia tomentosa TaxID=2675787 RepID=UPI00144A0DE0|nr:DUF721 domain-containing protein [Enterobacteriaceae endosymbiont of Donacia tomentosa]QJC31592.1 DUF721 domain-containing protein [Enterobacteriaceae endosymbiont of Donacia tomentosa]